MSDDARALKRRAARPPAVVREILERQTNESAELLEATVCRAFGGDVTNLGRFVSTLTPVLPAGTKIFLRGSSVTGQSYVSGEPFDAHGPGSSDLDIVVSGDEVMNLFSGDGFYCPRVNSRPLCDSDRDVAPLLEKARSESQALVGRPVSIQAMAEWFLDLRSAAQQTPAIQLGRVPW